jgi:tetratricopeptide (TPR) repeat protein
MRWLWIALPLTACQPRGVIRVVDGVPTEGRFVTDIAYANYLWGAELEAREQLEDALQAYAAAAAYDPASVEIRVRIGSIRCRTGQTEAATRAFSEAEAIDEHYEPLWRERADCAAAEGALTEALAHAERAHRADPGRVETTILYARLLDATKRHDDAARYLRSLSVRHPHRLVVWEAIAAHAQATGNAAWQVEASRRIARHGPATRPSADWSAVDAALAARDQPSARRAMLRGGLDPRALAARAILVGRPRMALVEAELRLGANPDDADARVALALAYDLVGETGRAAEILGQLPASAESLGETAQILMAELLWRRVGAAETALFLGRSVGSTQELRRALAESFLER